ncbi:D-sedoheptulose-7-phosphate isomerase [Conservatibacter flavescens]|uniref:SIS domain-containing protein n=1 Tax=Conservatibacter flavescens TaxID=28161 RepID=A0A2M8S600_9PAST|nr:SIS domain-containing protein [Conservatibacter flavescens]PJG86554.1 SIS domain-containing protein [Conservatibacter flavescens]
MRDKIKDLYTESLQTQISAAELLPDAIMRAAEKMVECLISGHKIIVCGHGRGYANAQILVANLLNRYEFERPSFPAVLLSLDSAVGSAIIFDDNHMQLYQRQFNAVAQTGDLLIVLASGNEEVIVNVIHAAAGKDIPVVALTNAQNDHVHGALSENDVAIASPATKESRILENHLFVINALCELVDYQILFAPSAPSE